MTRTDIHKPSAIIPEDYDFIAAFSKAEGLADFDLLRQQEQLLQRHMEVTGGMRSSHKHGGNCHVCGASSREYAVFYHIPSNTYIRTGFDCAEKLDTGMEDLFRKIKTEAKAVEFSRKGALKAFGLLAEYGLGDAVKAIFKEQDHKKGLVDSSIAQHRTISDIFNTVVKTGRITDTQISFIKALLDQVERADEIKAQRDAEKALAEDAPEGKVVVEGEVVAIKIQESMYGITEKMLVKNQAGWTVWSTIPKAVSDVEKGAVVKFTATLTPSSDDRTFAFAKRPSKASIIA